MPSILGKRKSRNTEPSISAEDAQEVFRRHFESQFQPLEKPKKKHSKVEEEPEEEDLDTDDDDDSWDGVSDSEDDTAPAIEVVDHTSSQAHDPTASMSKRELKAFMSSRPPSSSSSKPAPAPSKDADSDSETERSLRAQDLALQRLLSESHLLSSFTPDTAHSTGASQKLFASGKLRHRTTDMRIQSLAASSAPLAKGPQSLFHQQKMPMVMRKRITATKGAKEDKRRREARENGIILEKESKTPAKDARGKRERTVDGPAVGRMRGAELKLSDRDIRSIEGGGGRGGRGNRGRGARGGYQGRR